MLHLPLPVPSAGARRLLSPAGAAPSRTAGMGKPGTARAPAGGSRSYGELGGGCVRLKAAGIFTVLHHGVGAGHLGKALLMIMYGISCALISTSSMLAMLWIVYKFSLPYVYAYLKSLIINCLKDDEIRGNVVEAVEDIAYTSFIENPYIRMKNLPLQTKMALASIPIVVPIVVKIVRWLFGGKGGK